MELSEKDPIFLCCRRPWGFLSLKSDADDREKELLSNKTALRELIDTRKMIDGGEGPNRPAT